MAEEILVALAGGVFDQHDQVLRVLQSAFAYQGGQVNPPSSVTRMTEEDVENDAKNGDLIVAETLEGEIVGCLFTKEDEDDKGPFFYLFHVAVLESHQGKGVGNRLLDLAETLAQSKSLDRVQIMSRVELKPVHAYFMNQGFKLIGTFNHDGFDRPTSLRFEKRL